MLNIAEHPIKSAMALFATVKDDTTATLHFAKDLMNAQTRPEALAQLKNDLHNIEHTVNDDWNLAINHPNIAAYELGRGVVFGAAMVATDAAVSVARVGMFGDAAGAAKNTRLISNITRVSSDVANKPFISDKAVVNGWNAPYPEHISLREITLSKETQFSRVFTNNKLQGQFIVRHDEISHIIDDPQALKIYLGLKYVPTHIADVFVPENTRILVGRIGPQPNFGLMNRSGFQYQLLDEIPEENFRNARPILFPEYCFNNHT